MLANNNFRMYRFAMLCFLLIVLISCNKKKTDYQATALKLSLDVSDNGMFLEWDEVNTSDFLRYEIFRSTSPIPEPTAKSPIDQSLRIASITEKDKHSFNDSVISGKNYYRIQAVLKFRNLVSNEVNGRLGALIAGSFGSTLISRKLGNMYFSNGSQWTVYNYKNDSVLVRNKFLNSTTSSNSQPTLTTNENGQDVLYTINSSGSTTTIWEYDANTLNLIRTHPSIAFSWNVSVAYAKGKLYYPYGDSILVYNLANDTRIGAVQTVNNYSLDLSSNENILFSNNASSTSSFNIYKILSDGNLQLVGQNNDITGTLANARYISPNGNYLASWNGSIFDKSLNYLGLLENPTFTSYTNIHFTDDEQFAVGQTSNEIHIYRTSTRNLLSSFIAQTSSFSSFRTHLDGNILFILENIFNPITGESMTSVKQRTLTF